MSTLDCGPAGDLTPGLLAACSLSGPSFEIVRTLPPAVSPCQVAVGFSGFPSDACGLARARLLFPGKMDERLHHPHAVPRATGCSLRAIHLHVHGTELTFRQHTERHGHLRWQGATRVTRRAPARRVNYSTRVYVTRYDGPEIDDIRSVF